MRYGKFAFRQDLSFHEPNPRTMRASGAVDATLTAWVAGDADARAAAYREYWPQLVSYLSGFASCPADAEDLAQEAWLRIERGIRTFDTSRPLWPWMSVVAKRVAINRYRQGRTPDGSLRTVAGDALMQAHAAVEPDHADRVEARDSIAWLLQPLSRRERLAVAGALHGLSADETGRLLGLNANGVRQLAFRARAKARERMRLGHTIGGLLPPWARRLLDGVHGRAVEALVSGGMALVAPAVVAMMMVAPVVGRAAVPQGVLTRQVTTATAVAERQAAGEMAVKRTAVGRRDTVEGGRATARRQPSAGQQRPSSTLAELPDVAVPGTGIRSSNTPTADPDYRIGVRGPRQLPLWQAGATVKDDPDSPVGRASAAACAAARAAQPFTYCEASAEAGR